MSGTGHAALGRPLKAIALALSYPDTALRTHADEVASVLAERPEFGRAERTALAGFVRWLTDTDLLDAQGSYVATFDRSKKVSLYLFEHVYGESRDRGPAMVELSHAYREHGLEIASSELPDYLPMFLEFLAMLPDGEARAWLDDIGHILQRVHVRLAERQSPYAAPFRLLARLAGVDPTPEALTRMASEEERDDTRAALDRVWMEAPVTFGPDEPRTQCGATQQYREPTAGQRPPAAGARSGNPT